MQQRVGFGYDSHRWQAGRDLVLGGLKIPHERGLLGHSDADAVLHAVTDALLGAIAAGDIGEHFRDSDPRWRGADSSQFLRHAVALARGQGYGVLNCDVTILAEGPKLSPHKSAMRESIAALLGAPIEAVSVKAKTNEGMGFVGRNEGLAVFAVILLADQTK